tara:strand:- start:562 stop:1671 length:1110 start_codon:yes stop_codon:yes gene_type:complete
MSTYQIPLDQTNDIVEESDVKVSSALWSGGTGTLNNVYTSSVQSSSNGQYFLQLYDKDVSSSLAEKQFSVLYGHKGGSGSLGKPGVDGNRETATVYSQFLNLTQPPETELFTFENGTDVTKQHIYAISFDRARMREKVDPGNWQLNLSGNKSTVKVELIDDSSTNTSPVNSHGITEFNIVSGSIQGGSTTIEKAASSEGAASGSYGKFYPDFGLIILSAHRLQCTRLGAGTAGVHTLSVPQQDPLFYLANKTGSNVINSRISHSLHRMVQAINSGSLFQARREEVVSSQHFFCRARTSEFNSTSNPTYKTGTGADRDIREVFKNDPKTYITTVALYGDEVSQPLAIAKLSQPILKSKSREALIKVKLDF